MKKRVLLARPSSLIVSDMKRLMGDANVEPVPLTSLDDLTSTDSAEVAGIVISTALTSSVKESYCRVLEIAMRVHPGIPVFIASFTNIKRTLIIVKSHLKEANLDMDVLTLSEAQAKGDIDYFKEVTIITREEISDPQLYPGTLSVVSDMLSSRLQHSQRVAN